VNHLKELIDYSFIATYDKAKDETRLILLDMNEDDL
jgi:hypothetical protein